MPLTKLLATTVLPFWRVPIIMVKQGDDKAFDQLLGELNAGSVDVLIVWGANLVYTTAKAEALAATIGKAKLRLRFQWQMTKLPNCGLGSYGATFSGILG